MDKALILLQEIVAHQSEELARLSDELYVQQREANLLRAEIVSIKAMLKNGMSQESPMRSQEEETPPPHY